MNKICFCKLDLLTHKGLQPFWRKSRSAQAFKSLPGLGLSLNHLVIFPLIPSGRCYDRIDSRKCTLKTKYINTSSLPQRQTHWIPRRDWNWFNPISMQNALRRQTHWIPRRDWNKSLAPTVLSISGGKLTESLEGIETKRSLSIAAGNHGGKLTESLEGIETRGSAIARVKPDARQTHWIPRRDWNNSVSTNGGAKRCGKLTESLEGIETFFEPTLSLDQYSGKLTESLEGIETGYIKQQGSLFPSGKLTESLEGIETR